MTATVGGERVSAGVLVGADGANGVVAEGRRPRCGHRARRGPRGNVPWELLDHARYTATAVVELGSPSGGYGWLFPKGDHANLGVGGWASEGPRLRTHLRAARPHPRSRPRRPHGSARPPAADAPRRGSHLRLPDASCWSAMRRVSSTRCPVTACTRRSCPPGSRPRRSWRALSTAIPPRWPARSTTTPAHRGRPSARSTGIRACRFWAARSPGVFGVVSGLLRGDVRHPNEARGLAGRPSGSSRASRTAPEQEAQLYPRGERLQPSPGFNAGTSSLSG